MRPVIVLSPFIPRNEVNYVHIFESEMVSLSHIAIAAVSAALEDNWNWKSNYRLYALHLFLCMRAGQAD